MSELDPDSVSAIAAAIAAVAAMIAIAVTYLVSRQQLRFQARPVLAFSMGTNYQWRVENIGSGPTLHVLIGDRHRSGEWVSITNCYPLSAGASTDLTWLKAADELAAVYTSVDGHTFTTICRDNQNKFLSRNEFPEWMPTGEQWFWKMVAEARDETTLDETELEGKTAFELDVMRNEPYARQGLRMGSPELAAHFAKQPWYVPSDISQGAAFYRMTPRERAESHLILEFQNRRRLRSMTPIAQDSDHG